MSTSTCPRYELFVRMKFVPHKWTFTVSRTSTNTCNSVTIKNWVKITGKYIEFECLAKVCPTVTDSGVRSCWRQNCVIHKQTDFPSIRRVNDNMENAPNSFSAGGPPQTPLWTLPETPSRMGTGMHLHFLNPILLTPTAHRPETPSEVCNC